MTSRRLTSPFAVLLLVSLHAYAGPPTYSAKPIAAIVVDAETAQPLDGVIVIARWRLEERKTGIGVRDLDLTETTSDKDGKFRFSGWEGKAPPTGTEAVTDKTFLRYETRLSAGSPELILFKSGYNPRIVGNYLQSEQRREESQTWERHSEWDGKVIKLEKFKGNLEAYGSAAEGITTGLGSGIKCAWKKTPRLYASLIRERQRLDNLGVRNYLPTLALMDLNFKNSGCGSAREFFEDYLK